MVRNPFCTELDVYSIPDNIQEFLDLMNDYSARDLFKVKSVPQSYTQVSMIALRVLLPFASTYLCEARFSTLVDIKTKNRNRLNVGDDMRLALKRSTTNLTTCCSNIRHPTSWVGKLFKHMLIVL